MKPMHCIPSRWLVFLSLLHISISSSGQVDLLKNTVNGEPIISSGMNFSSDGTIGVGAVATSTSAYMIDKKGQTHNFLTVGRQKIVDISSKVKGDSFQVLILYSDGAATLVKPYLLGGSYGYIYQDFKKADSSAISKSFKKIQGDDVYVLSTSGFYVTRNLGKSWQWDTAGVNGAYIYDFSLDTVQNVYLATSKGIFMQSATGSTWTKLSKFKSSSASIIFIDHKNRIVVNTGSSKGQYISNDGGSTWTQDTSGLGNLFINKITDDAYGNLYAITTDFVNTRIYKSDGGTAAWKAIDGGLRTLVGSNIGISSLSADSILMAGTSFGLFTSADLGKTWKENNNGIHAEQATSMAKTSDGRIFITTNLGLFRFDAGDTSWTKVYPISGYKNNLSVVADRSGALYVFDYTLNPKYSATPMLKSTDDGANWKADTTGLSKVLGSVFFMDETGTQHWASSLYGGSYTDQVWSRQPGGNWKQDNSGLPSKNYSYFSAMGSDRQGYIYASGFISPAPAMYRKAISGTTWQLDTLGLSGNSIRQMASGGRSGILAWNGSRIFHLSGNSWKTIPLPSSISYPSIGALSVDSNSTVFASFTDLFGSFAGVYYTADTGASWIYAGLANTDVVSMQSYGDTTYVLTRNNWVYRIMARPFTAVRNAIQTEEANACLYPNPFNVSASLRFTLAEASQVKIEIFNMTGEKVISIAEQSETAGDHIIHLNTENLPAGIYIYRFSIGSIVQSGKMIKE